MMVRRLLAGVILAGLAVPVLATAPHPSAPKPAPAVLALTAGARALARADAPTVAQTTPAPTTTASAAEGPAPAGVVAPSASPTPASLGAAQSEFLAFQSGKIDRSHYTSAANAEFTTEKIAQASAGLKTLGTFKDITQLERADRDGLTLYLYRVRATGGTVQMLVAVDKSGKFAGIVFRPDRPE